MKDNKFTVIVPLLPIFAVCVSFGLAIKFAPNSNKKVLPTIQPFKYGSPVEPFTPDHSPIPLEELPKEELRNIAEDIFFAYNLPQGLASTMLEYESKTGELMLSKTGCRGWWQFCNKTRKAYGLSKNDTMDLVKSTHAAARLMVDNMRSLKKKGYRITPLRLYLCHMIGVSGTVLMLKARSGKRLTRKQKSKLIKVLRPNWTKKGMGRFNVSNTVRARKFFKHVNKNFIRLSNKVNLTDL